MPLEIGIDRMAKWARSIGPRQTPRFEDIEVYREMPEVWLDDVSEEDGSERVSPFVLPEHSNPRSLATVPCCAGWNWSGMRSLRVGSTSGGAIDMNIPTWRPWRTVLRFLVRIPPADLPFPEAPAFLMSLFVAYPGWISTF